MLERDLAAEIERWWEVEAERVADCGNPNPELCRNHVFEEAVRVDGEIVACTVHGRRLAESLATHLMDASRRYEEALKRVALFGYVPHRFPAEDPGHVQGCGAGKDVTKACICPAARRRVGIVEEADPPTPLPPELRL